MSFLALLIVLLYKIKGFYISFFESPNFWISLIDNVATYGSTVKCSKAQKNMFSMIKYITVSLLCANKVKLVIIFNINEACTNETF